MKDSTKTSRPTFYLRGLGRSKGDSADPVIVFEHEGIRLVNKRAHDATVTKFGEWDPFKDEHETFTESIHVAESNVLEKRSTHKNAMGEVVDVWAECSDLDVESILFVLEALRGDE